MFGFTFEQWHSLTAWQRMAILAGDNPWNLTVIDVNTGDIVVQQHPSSLKLVIEWMGRIGQLDYNRTDHAFTAWLTAGDPNPQRFLDGLLDLTPHYRVQADMLPAPPVLHTPPPLIEDEEVKTRLLAALAEPEQQRPPSPPVWHPWGREGFPTNPTDADMAALAQYWSENPNRPPPGWTPATTAGNPRAILPGPAMPVPPPGPIRTQRRQSSRAEPYPLVRPARNPGSGTGGSSTGGFACPHCGARYVKKGNMVRHVKQKHPDN